MFRMKALPTFPYRLKPHDRLYFLHIYKTAGTTFRAMLESRFDRAEICPAHLVGDLVALPRAALAEYRLFWGHLGFKLAECLPEEMIYLTLLRDPVEHVLSIYQAVRREPSHLLHDKVTRAGMSLDEFLRDEDAVPFVRNQQVFTLAWWHLVQDRLPETTAIRREVDANFRSVPDGVLVDLALERLDRFAFVGVTERMADAMRLLAYTFGWEAFGDVPRLNAAPERMRKEELPRHTLEAIQDLTRQDAQVYAHVERLFETRFRQMTAAEELSNQARDGAPADGGTVRLFWGRVAQDLRDLPAAREALILAQADLAESRRMCVKARMEAEAVRKAGNEARAEARAEAQAALDKARAEHAAAAAQAQAEMSAVHQAYEAFRSQYTAATEYIHHLEGRVAASHQELGQALVRLELSEHVSAGLKVELDHAHARLAPYGDLGPGYLKAARGLKRLVGALPLPTRLVKRLLRPSAAPVADAPTILPFPAAAEQDEHPGQSHCA